MSNATENRYARDWNTYSEAWDQQYGPRYRHLGDEWCDDGTTAREWERRLFAHAIEPYLTPATRALEIGPGGGKWTVRLAPKVQTLTAFDLAQAMLARTEARVNQAGLVNVSYVLGQGQGPALAAIPSASLDLVFSYDVFVHIALEDTVAYLSEISRVLRDGGVVILHHAVNDTAAAWDRIESHNDWYRNRENTLGQYYYHSRDAIERMYARAGLRIASAWSDYCTVVVTAHKPGDTIVPRLEEALMQAGTAGDDAQLEQAVAAIQAAGEELRHRYNALVATLRTTPHGRKRFEIVQQIRRLVRG